MEGDHTEHAHSGQVTSTAVSGRTSSMEGHLRLPTDALVKVVANKPRCRRSSKFVVATARREIHGDLLHRMKLPPNLQGFFHGEGDTNGLSFFDEEAYVLPLHHGRFASLFSPAPAMDPSFGFITKALPAADGIVLLHSCNGLLLFGRFMAPGTPGFELGYVVCNPATEQWTAVPSCYWVDAPINFVLALTHASLVFDPAVSSQFQLVLFCDHIDIDVGTVTTTAHTYSSETRVWSHSETDWSQEEDHGLWEGWRCRELSGVSVSTAAFGFSSAAVVDGMLYLILWARNQVLKVDAQGKTRRIIPAPAVRGDAESFAFFVGQSQGLLHCIVEEGYYKEISSYLCREWTGYGVLSVWVLNQDSDDEEEWALKHRITVTQLFGKKLRSLDDYKVITMHPDRNIVFFIQQRDVRRLISYDIDRQQVCVLQSLQDDYGTIAPSDSITVTPYIPYLSELFLGVIGAHK